MSERITAEPGSNHTSQSNERNCCGITDGRGRFHGGIEHGTDSRFNVRSKHNVWPNHNAEPDHPSSSGHRTTRNNESEQHNSGNGVTDTRYGGTDARYGNSNSGNCNA